MDRDVVEAAVAVIALTLTHSGSSRGITSRPRHHVLRRMKERTVLLLRQLEREWRLASQRAPIRHGTTLTARGANRRAYLQSKLGRRTDATHLAVPTQPHRLGVCQRVQSSHPTTRDLSSLDAPTSTSARGGTLLSLSNQDARTTHARTYAHESAHPTEPEPTGTASQGGTESPGCTRSPFASTRQISTRRACAPAFSRIRHL